MSFVQSKSGLWVSDTEVNSAPLKNGNGIGGGNNFFGFPANQGLPITENLSTPNDTFINLRWYFISNMWQFLSQAYCEISLVSTICAVPVQDALRGGVELKSEELGEDNLQFLTSSLDRDDDLTTVGQAAIWNRLYGGAGIMVLTDQDPEEPLDVKQIKRDTPLEFRAVDMWELFWDLQNATGYDVGLQEQDFEWYRYYSLPVHKSRVMRIKGLVAPAFLRPRLRGWGFSVVEGLIRSLNQYLRAADVAYDVLDEFKLDIYKVKNLVNTLLAPNAQQMIMQRIQQCNYTKNYQNAIVMDSEDDYLQKQLSFSGLGDWMQQIRMQVASDMRMPMLKLFGTPASGLNASDEESIEVYNAMVESEVRNKIKYDILRLCELKCQKFFGFIPEDLSLTFKPLRVMSGEQEETIKTQKFNRLYQAAMANLITVDEFRDGCNRGKIMDITLGEQGAQGGYMQDQIQEGKNQPYDPLDLDNPGANRVDSRKTRATEVGGAGQGQMPHEKRENANDDEKLANPGKVDEALWAKAKEASQKALGKIKYAFVTWWYKEQGGTFG